MEEQVKLDEVEIGEDTPQVEAKTVKIENYNIEKVEKEEKHIGDKLVLSVKHPDFEEFLEISQIKYEFGEKIKVSGLWVKLDKDSKLPYKSALAHFLRYVHRNNIKDLVGVEVNTTTNENGYLVIKAY